MYGSSFGDAVGLLASQRRRLHSALLLGVACSVALLLGAAPAHAACGIPAGTNLGIDTAAYPPPRPCLHPLPNPPDPRKLPGKPSLLPPLSHFESATAPTAPRPPASSPPSSTALSPLVAGAAYGLSDPDFPAFCPSGGSCTNALTTLKNDLGLSYARIGVPYDTMATYDPNAGCVYDFSQNVDKRNSNTPYWAELYYWLQAVSRAGLTPEIVLTQGTGLDPNTGAADPGLPTSANATYALYDYYCGMYYLMDFTPPNGGGWGYPVTHWEAFNEPDTFDGAFTAADDAYVWSWANVAAGSFSPDTVAALTLSSMINVSKVAYLDNFLTTLRQAGDPLPTTYSLHDYEDVDQDAAYQTNTITGNLDSFRSNLATEGVSGEPIWITEAGVRLNDPNPDCCGSTLGADVDGSGLDQAWGAAGFKYLATQPNVTQDLWYELQAYDNNGGGYDGFDSAPVGADGSGKDNGNSGNLSVYRPSYCVLEGNSPSVSNGSYGCHDVIGFTGPAEVCHSAGPFGQTETQIYESQADSDWEDPCSG